MTVDLTEMQALWSALVGSALPLLIAVIQQPTFSKPMRTLVAVVTCLVAGAVQAFLDGKLADGKSVTAMTMIIVVSAMTFYKSVWKPLGATGAIERALTGPPAG